MEDPIVNVRPARSVTWLLVMLALAVASRQPASAQDDAQPAAAGDKKMDKDGGTDAESAGPADKGDAGGRGMKDKAGSGKKTEKAPASKTYLYKSQKKTKLAGAEVTSLIVTDVFSGKRETLVVPDAAVAAVLDDLKEGTPITVEAEKKGGKWTVTSLAKADVQAGEEQPNGFVYVAYDESKDRAGNKTATVTLRKFGREVKVGVPMWKNNNYEEPTWEPDPKVDGQLQRLEKGEVVAARIKSGQPPMLLEVYPYEPPERGKFVKVKESNYNGATAAAFEMVAADGTTITITLPGTEDKFGEQKVLKPDVKTWRAVQKIKADTEIEVLFREEGQTNFLIDIKFLKPAASKGAKAEEDKMKPGEKQDDSEAGKGGGEKGGKDR